MVICQSANQLKTPAKVSWAFKMVSQFGSLGYTIMGKTADLTVVQKTIIGCVSFRRLHPPEVSFEGCIRHRGCLISEKQVGHSECDLRMRPSFTRIRRMHQVYPSLLQITHNSLRRRKPSLIWKMLAPADVHTSADVSFQLKSASSKNG